MTGHPNETEEPPVVCPFPYRENPHTAAARAQLTGWVEQTGLVQRESARERFERADFGWFAALVYPTADRASVELMADWFAWLFLVDDQLDDGTIGRSLGNLEQAVEQLRAVLEAPNPDTFAADRHLPAAVKALADLWDRTAAGATTSWRRRFSRHLEDCLVSAAVWEAGNRVRGVVPDEATYIEKRRHTGAIYVCMDFIDIVERLDVPEALYESAEFTAALNAACNVVCWTNDIYSLSKERSLGEVHNLAYLKQYHHGLDRDQALAETRRAVSAETRRFLIAEETVLRIHSRHTPVLAPYLAGMRTWMRGNLDWSRRTERYRSTPDTAPSPSEYVELTVMAEEQ